MVIDNKSAGKLRLNQRKQLVITASYQLFIEKKIEATSIQEIADKAEVGVASVYRYFINKSELTVEAAILSWENCLNPLLEKVINEKDGGIAAFMDCYIDLFIEKPEFFRYLEDFDNYISKLDIYPQAIGRYEKMLSKQDNIINAIVQKDRDKGILKPDIDLETYILMAGQAVMSLAQKLLNRGTVISRDKENDPIVLLKMLIETLYNNMLKD